MEIRVEQREPGGGSLTRIEGEIRKFIHENFIVDGENHLGSEDSLLEKGIIDSTGVLELVAFIEETYLFKVDDEELIPENLDSIMNISRYIHQKIEIGANPSDRESILH
jgi:acyl carrier protein